MSLSKISIVIGGATFSLFLAGLIKNAELYRNLRTIILAKYQLAGALKAGGTNTQDDFRTEAYGVLKYYSDKHLLGSLFLSEYGVLENEKKEILARIKNKKRKGGIFTVMEGKVAGGIIMRGRSGGESRLRERVYFYTSGRHYHKRRTCSEFVESEETKIFPTMEAAAGKGFFPCECCVLRTK